MFEWHACSLALWSQTEQALRAKEREVERLTKALEGTKTGEAEAALRLSRADDAARAAADEAVLAKQRAVQVGVLWCYVCLAHQVDVCMARGWRHVASQF